MRSPKKTLIDAPVAAPARNPREPWPPRLPNGRRPARLPEDDAPPATTPPAAPAIEE